MNYEDLFPIQRGQIHPKRKTDNNAFPYDSISSNNNTTTSSPVPLLLRTGLQLLLNPGNILSLNNFDTKGIEGISTMLSQETNRNRLIQLKGLSNNVDNNSTINYKYGIYFLYGMFFESLFTVNENLWPPALLSSKASSRCVDDLGDNSDSTGDTTGDKDEHSPSPS